MRKLFHCFIVSLLTFLLLTSYFLLPARADELEDIAKQLAELEKARNMSVNATKPLESELNRLNQKLTNIQAGIKKAEDNLVALEQSIDKREQDFNARYVILSESAESYYKSLRQPSGFLLLLSSQTASGLTKDLSYRQAVTDKDKNMIAQISTELLQLEADRKKVAADKQTLADLKVKTDQQAEFFRKEVAGAKAYQAQLSSQIAQLSSRQQQLLAEKLGSLNLPTSLGAGPLYCTDDRKVDPGFQPAFAFFTFGIPHRVGMNQYGALGRAQAGQSYKNILQAYFQNISFENRDPNMTIKVQGYGSMGLDQYLLGIYEMPGDWPIEALKAQVVAARSYALAYTDNGNKEICTTQACQVYKGGNKGGKWEEAVRATPGEVMVSGGQVITAWYASTAGGYTFRSADVGWSDRPWTKRLRDTSAGIDNFSQLMERAYDKDSPCFYAAQGWRSEYSKSAWLKSEEVADIVNVLLLAKADSGTQTHLSQPDKPNPDGTETWDANRVKQELRSRGISVYNQISNISISWDKDMGRTTSVSISGDGGSANFEAGEFRNFFNLRAPANIQIVGPLFNIEKK
jgi:SpoIID/LytB domain protein